MLVVWQSGLIVSARWPVTQPVDEVVIKSSAYLMDVVHDLRKRLKAATEPRKVWRHSLAPNHKYYVSLIELQISQ